MARQVAQAQRSCLAALGAVMCAFRSRCGARMRTPPTREAVSPVKPWKMVKAVTSRRFPGDYRERLVYLALFSHTNSEGTCWPSLPTLAAETGLSRSVVSPAVLRLRDRGLVELESRKGRVNRYWLPAEQLLALVEEECAPVQNPDGLGNWSPSDITHPTANKTTPVQNQDGTSPEFGPEVVKEVAEGSSYYTHGHTASGNTGDSSHEEDPTHPNNKGSPGDDAPALTMDAVVAEIHAAAEALPQGHAEKALAIAETFRRDRLATVAHHQLGLLAKLAGVDRARFPTIRALVLAGSGVRR
jgi:hypothetical protein